MLSMKSGQIPFNRRAALRLAGDSEFSLGYRQLEISQYGQTVHVVSGEGWGGDRWDRGVDGRNEPCARPASSAK
jgi:hypothetical protein